MGESDLRRRLRREQGVLALLVVALAGVAVATASGSITGGAESLLGLFLGALPFLLSRGLGAMSDTSDSDATALEHAGIVRPPQIPTVVSTAIVLILVVTPAVAFFFLLTEDERGQVERLAPIVVLVAMVAAQVERVRRRERERLAGPRPDVGT